MTPQQTGKRPANATELYSKNAKQREIYRNMPITEKKALLQQRRHNKREATTRRILGNTNSLNPAEPICLSQDNLDVGCSSSISKPASGTANDSHIEAVRTNVTDRTILSSSTVVDGQQKPTYPFHAFEKGLAKGKKIAANISQLRSDYNHLQKVPDCKFCAAKRFQYEAPGFCCGKGHITVNFARSGGPVTVNTKMVKAHLRVSDNVSMNKFVPLLINLSIRGSAFCQLGWKCMLKENTGKVNVIPSCTDIDPESRQIQLTSISFGTKEILTMNPSRLPIVSSATFSAPELPPSQQCSYTQSALNGILVSTNGGGWLVFATLLVSPQTVVEEA
ncbi:hypothetical protein RDI58_008735 [Solanum bulbocastanum]|uniref:Uncharacterized protein n=1 Tax=Solanum bulbocastanum TaxID=147425 RepID=A0AAN8YK48_SOLBU